MTRLIRLGIFLGWMLALLLAACSNQAADKSYKPPALHSSSTAHQHSFVSITDSAHKGEQAKVYAQAISEYIKAIYSKDSVKFDTLFFGRHNDFPNIDLPATIQNTNIVLLTAEEADLKRRYNKSLVYINMFGGISEHKAEFILVAFFPGYQHQHDYFIDLHNAEQKEFEVEQSRFENYIYNKDGQLERIAMYKDGAYVGDKPMSDKNE